MKIYFILSKQISTKYISEHKENHIHSWTRLIKNHYITQKHLLRSLHTQQFTQLLLVLLCLFFLVIFNSAIRGTCIFIKCVAMNNVQYKNKLKSIQSYTQIEDVQRSVVLLVKWRKVNSSCYKLPGSWFCCIKCTRQLLLMWNDVNSIIVKLIIYQL